MCQLSVSSAAASDSLGMGCPQFLNGGLRLDFGVLQWSKSVEIRKARNEKKKTTLTESLHITRGQLRRTAPHKLLRPTKLSHAPYGLCAGMGFTRQQS